MRRLLRADEYRADEVRTALRVISAFDDLQQRSPTLDDLAELAAEITGHAVIIDDLLTWHRVEVGTERVGLHDADALVHRVMALRVRGPQPVGIDVDGLSVLAASVEHAEGRLGTACILTGAGTPWTSHDELTVERLAQAVAVVGLRQRERRISHGVRESLQHLLTRGVDHDEGLTLAAVARLDPEREYQAMVVEESPSHAASPHALLTAIGRTGHSDPLHECVVGRHAVIVTRPSESSAYAAGFYRTAQESGRITVRIGIGSVARPVRLKGSLIHAKESLLLGSPRTGIVVHHELGALGLLGGLPSHLVHDQPDIALLLTLQSQSTLTSFDIGIVENYCETGSLRRTADDVGMHHSSVDYRLKQFEALLGFSLRSQEGKLRALLAIRLARLESAN